MDIFDKAIKLYKNCKSLSSYKEDFLVKIVDADETLEYEDSNLAEFSEPSGTTDSLNL